MQTSLTIVVTGGCTRLNTSSSPYLAITKYKFGFKIMFLILNPAPELSPFQPQPINLQDSTQIHFIVPPKGVPSHNNSVGLILFKEAHEIKKPPESSKNAISRKRGSHQSFSSLDNPIEFGIIEKKVSWNSRKHPKSYLSKSLKCFTLLFGCHFSGTKPPSLEGDMPVG